ncbi:Uncharacterised protein [Listeria fleischmannii subsp. fleischmannii]|uniref:Uncharacterized protein n=1 Tax=Listeria fleischmannii subsp. fleischmannii TaxID=1671902 RepID=A0A2X3JCK2_9LIST|nr:hypothetical protein [Listeria fleischmannii]SQC72070.1 Uncharacterised protein [Listeria fleischmannii subsp. fleischmannii]
MKRETRFSALYKANPDTALSISNATKEDALRRFTRYANMAGVDISKVLGTEAAGENTESAEDAKARREARRKERLANRSEKTVDPEREARRLAREARKKAKLDNKE